MFGKNKMKVAAFCGSPRKNGNTETLLQEVVKGIEDSGHSVETFYLNSMDIKACQDCGGCNTGGECIIHDDMDQIYVAIRNSHRIVIASPIFFFSLSAQTKVMIDRCQSLWCEKYLMKKPIEPGELGRKGLLLMVGGMKKKVGVECGEACAKAFFRTISVPEHETIYYLEVDAKGDILKHPSAIRDAYEAGKKLVSK